MKVKMLRFVSHKKDELLVGDVVDLPKNEAEEFIAKRLAEEIKQRKAKVKEEKGKAETKEEKTGKKNKRIF